MGSVVTADSMYWRGLTLILTCCVQAMDDVQIKSAAVDIFCYIVEFSPVTVREFMVREARQQDDVS